MKRAPITMGAMAEDLDLYLADEKLRPDTRPASLADESPRPDARPAGGAWWKRLWKFKAPR